MSEAAFRASPYKAGQPSYVLWLIRDRQPVPLADVFLHFGWSIGDTETAPSNLRNTVDMLEQVGLIEKTAPGPVLSTTFLLNEVTRALGVSLKHLATTDPHSTITVSPAWGIPSTSPFTTDLFVLMPFSTESDLIYTNHIRPVASELGLRCRRADEIFTRQSVMKDIWSAISTAKVVLGDLTGRNPNVFYELGIAHTLGKPAVLVTQDIDDAPFDIRGWRIIEYRPDVGGLAKFEVELRSALLALAA